MFKIGDKLIIRRSLEFGQVSENGLCFVNRNIFNSRGEVVEVIKIVDNNKYTLVNNKTGNEFTVLLFDDFIEGIVDGEYMIECSRCGQLHPYETTTFLSNKKVYVCDECIKHSNKCDVCGDVFFYSGTKDIDGNIMCDNCVEKYGRVLSYHHYDNDSWEDRLSGIDDNSLLIGCELEVDNERDDDLDKTQMILDIVKIMGKSIVFERDGSLHDGVEIITHPFSFNFWHDKEEYIKKMLLTCSNYGYKSHDTSTCGLHFHVNRKQLKTSTRSCDEVVDNILLIMETFKNELVSFSRRHSTEYAQYLSDKTRIYKKPNLKFIKNYKTRHDRYMALNIGNSNTIEFRMFKGTLRFETLMASIELVNNICNIAKYENIDGLTWLDIINYNSDANKYIVDYNSSMVSNVDSNKKVCLLTYLDLHAEEITIDNFAKGMFSINLEQVSYDKYTSYVEGILRALNVKNTLNHYVNCNDIAYNSVKIVDGKVCIHTRDEDESVDVDDLYIHWQQ